jgi:hypothetical protein
MDKTNNDKSRKPVISFRSNGISVAVFENSSDDGNIFHKVSAERVYKTGNKFATTNSFSFSELPVVVMLMKRAWYHILAVESQNKSNSKQD